MLRCQVHLWWWPQHHLRLAVPLRLWQMSSMPLMMAQWPASMWAPPARTWLSSSMCRCLIHLWWRCKDNYPCGLHQHRAGLLRLFLRSCGVHHWKCTMERRSFLLVCRCCEHLYWKHSDQSIQVQPAPSRSSSPMRWFQEGLWQSQWRVSTWVPLPLS